MLYRLYVVFTVPSSRRNIDVDTLPEEVLVHSAIQSASAHRRENSIVFEAPSEDAAIEVAKDYCEGLNWDTRILEEVRSTEGDFAFRRVVDYMTHSSD